MPDSKPPSQTSNTESLAAQDSLTHYLKTREGARHALALCFLVAFANIMFSFCPGLPPAWWQTLVMGLWLAGNLTTLLVLGPVMVAWVYLFGHRPRRTNKGFVAECLASQEAAVPITLRKGATAKGLFLVIKADTPCLPGFWLVIASLVIGEIVRFLSSAMTLGGMESVLACAFVVSSLPIFAGVVSSYLGSKLPTVRLPALRGSLRQKLSIAHRLSSLLTASTRNLLTQQIPFLSVPLSLLVFSCVMAFAPSGVGACIAGWLEAATRDANISQAVNTDPAFTAVVSGLIAIAIVTAGHTYAARLGAAFPLFLQDFFSLKAGDNILESVFQAGIIPSTKIQLPDRLPKLRMALETVLWLLACYATLFWLVAFCPGPLGDAIKTWLSHPVHNGNEVPSILTNFNFRLFIASIVAAYGTAQMAVTCCVFLPTHRLKIGQISSQGILIADALPFPRLKFWNQLKSITISKSWNRKEDLLTLSFGLDSIVLVISQLTAEQMATLVAAADEFAGACKVNAQFVAFRQNLAQKVNGVSLADSEKFDSSAFGLHTVGELVNEGAYRIVRKLASFSLSATYLARTTDGDMVVIKQFVLPAESQAAQHCRDTFQREYEMLERATHPRMTKVIECFEDGRSTYLVLEHIRGIDLRKLVASRGPRSEKTVLNWIRQLCDQVRHLHEQDPPILHRDLTPDNVMLDEDGNLRIIDFGAAHEFMEGITGTLIGKQSYIAPEQLRGKASTASDIYSMGQMIYFLLTGRDPRALAQSQLSKSGVHVSERLDRLVSQCTAFDESDRIQTVEQLLAQLNGHASLSNELGDLTPDAQKCQEVSTLVEVGSKTEDGHGESITIKTRETVND